MKATVMQRIRFREKKIGESTVYYVEYRNPLGRWWFLTGENGVPRCFGSLKEAVEASGCALVIPLDEDT